MKDSVVPKLTGSLDLRFGLNEETSSAAVQIVSIPSSILGPKRTFCITISKVNGWPVNAFARIFPEHAATLDEARPLIAELLKNEDIWDEAGLDVEKLTFEVAEDRPLGIGENYWLVIGLKRVDAELISSSSSSIYNDYALNLRVEVLPWSLVPLLTLLLMTLIVYFGMLRKYHLRLFSLK